MKELWDTLFGLHATSTTITALQMMTRALLVFFAALLLLRVSGKRTFGGNATFDIVVKIMLGAVLSRTVVAASPFCGTLLACLVLVGLRRLLAWGSFHSHLVGRLVKGDEYVLVENGQINQENLSRNNLSRKDLMEGVRESGHLETLDEDEIVRLERDGSISVVKKKPE
ncbi:hypothetical protein AUC43_07780 [Hymenobacter sedentarius]|uniref:YetF C-terminal domain-containing protein n=1 Tax=Hymenobacter sedentarius TaxID=1411621 RepID=A0A0U4C475_9BACT|nr:YetF domain-containing protein [Hymenobacter sedentarius]ALW85000.1 hypothetical protein AUC43_07780 [Hymenobacter sedentarius]